MWAFHSQAGRFLEQVQGVLLCNERTVVVYEVVSTLYAPTLTCDLLERRYRHKGFKILVRFHIYRCRVFKGLTAILAKNQKALFMKTSIVNLPIKLNASKIAL